jgi:protein TonB
MHMFERAILINEDPAKRIWTTGMGFGSQLLMVTGMVLAPLIWPQALPRPQSLLQLFEPVAPPAPVHLVPVHPQAAHVAQPSSQFSADVLRLPVQIPPHAVILDDPPAAPAVSGMTTGIPGGLPELLSGGNILGRILEPLLAPEAPRAAPAPEPAAPGAPPRYKVGGLVKMARLIRRVDPLYPPLARQARISGVVELEGVIGIDGRLRELTVKSGHPLLVRAAIDAVRQWLYEPTTLNGESVEVVAPITVSFHLN